MAGEVVYESSRSSRIDGSLFGLVWLLLSVYRERRLWNRGICKKCRLSWKFYMCSDVGERVYTCGKHRVYVFWWSDQVKAPTEEW